MKSHRHSRVVLALSLLPILVVGSAVASDRLYIHPSRGQSDQQLSDDRYHCHRWAVDQTGYDPTRDDGYRDPGPVRVAVPDNPKEGATGKGLLAGAAAGAVIGAIDDHPGRGAAIGAVIGAIAGSEVESRGEDQARAEATAEAQAQAEAMGEERDARLQSRQDYRRAFSACLEGRGYTVR